MPKTPAERREAYANALRKQHPRAAAIAADIVTLCDTAAECGVAEAFATIPGVLTDAERSAVFALLRHAGVTVGTADAKGALVLWGWAP